VLLLVVAVMMVATGCGPKEMFHDVGRARAGDGVVLEGKLTLRGSTPHPLVVLQVKDGDGVLLESDRFRRDFESLGDLRIRVVGTFAGRLNGMPSVTVSHYRLLALPGGDVPVVGILRVESNHVVLELPDKRRFWIVGDLAGVIREYVGARLWVAGRRVTELSDSAPQGTVPLRATGYGVIDEAPSP